MSEPFKPYVSLGSHLRYVREQSKQSLSEVSGAVEIEEKHLEQIEAGEDRPAEDILLLLISHFRVKDHEAVQLWELADYDSDMPDEIRLDADAGHNHKQQVMLLALDVRTMYSDGLDVVVNPAGVTLHFNQTTGKIQTAPIAKIGMSHQQAEMVMKTIQQALLHAKYNDGNRLLPPPSSEA
ncbi:MAG TPA: helix-turn-helix transcriptional regulator [Methylomirabilota bacterium]|nr:helix-turn-helix transcriptional regulator [Methylomirabilota bacterium]